VGTSSGTVRVARTLAEYREVRAAGAHACLVAVQGGNALDAAPDGPASIPDRLVTRVTLLHLTSSALGTTSTPIPSLRRHKGLTAKGKALVEQLDAARVFVDLAHIHPDGFWDAVEVHDPSLPLLATHTGVAGVTPHWRNLDDDQLRAIADTGGVVGIIFSVHFLRGRHGHRDAAMIVEHLAHVVKVVGEDFAALGSDLDGAIVPPPDLRGVDRWPRLVQAMLDRGWKEPRIRKILGENFLRAFGALRPG
jgi:membrane dipeptidase